MVRRRSGLWHTRCTLEGPSDFRIQSAGAFAELLDKRFGVVASDLKRDGRADVSEHRIRRLLV
jgi:hypothetical protein